MTSNNRLSRLTSFLLLLALTPAAITFAPAQQTPKRERRSTATPTASPTPTPTATPFAKPSSDPTSVKTQIPQAAPSPTAASGQPKIASPTKTLSELQARIAAVLRTPELAPATVGIKVASLDTGRVLFEENAHKLLRPASNMKLYTVAAALDRLSPDFRFTTSVYAAARPDRAGVVHGDLTIYGRGDPSIAARFNNGDYLKAIDDLASRVSATGVKRVEGDLIGDETYFTGPQYGSGWEWEDLQWYYGAEVSALTVNDNALDLFVKPGLEVGAQVVVTTGPPDPLIKIINRAITAPKGTKRDLTVHRGLAADLVEISGSVPLDDKGYEGGVGISHPALLFVYLLRSSLARRGVTITGRSRTVAASAMGGISVDPVQFYAKLADVKSAPPFEIASMQSPTLSVVAAQTLKPSQNLYTELILRTLGKAVPPASTPANAPRTSEDAGLEVVRTFLKEAGLTPSALVLSDGSGLSRNDMVTAEASLQLLTYMSHHRYASVFREALPIAGVDGTLRNRLKGTVAENNVRAKTGSLSSAASLSGYVTSAAGENLVFSIMVNNFPEEAEPRIVCIDPIVVLLASFAGRS